VKQENAMSFTVTGFVCEERWKDEKGRLRKRRHGRVYHSRAACAALADLVRKIPADLTQVDREVVCTEAYGEDGIGSKA
jgi:hypothetical protein